MGTPDWQGWLNSVWGPGIECPGPGSIIALASNIVVGSNPPYGLADFLTLYPKWGGTPIAGVTATLVAGNPQITVNSSAGMAIGNPISGVGIPANTSITAISGPTVTLSNAPINSGAGVALTVWNNPLIPFAVLQAYIALASASLIQGKWLDQWVFAMGLFVAHFATLYARSDGTPTTSVAQAASNGLAFGILVAKSVGDVSASYQLVGGLEDWGAWNLTVFGMQLVTMARIVGMGPLMLW